MTQSICYLRTEKEACFPLVAGALFPLPACDSRVYSSLSSPSAMAAPRAIGGIGPGASPVSGA